MLAGLTDCRLQREDEPLLDLLAGVTFTAWEFIPGGEDIGNDVAVGHLILLVSEPEPTCWLSETFSAARRPSPAEPV